MYARLHLLLGVSIRASQKRKHTPSQNGVPRTRGEADVCTP